MGGRATVERLLDGVLPAHALTDRGPTVVVLRWCTHNVEHRVLERASVTASTHTVVLQAVAATTVLERARDLPTQQWIHPPPAVMVIG
jgi:hypothetical protein